jgi:hypothetical protein
MGDVSTNQFRAEIILHDEDLPMKELNALFTWQLFDPGQGERFCCPANMICPRTRETIEAVSIRNTLRHEQPGPREKGRHGVPLGYFLCFGKVLCYAMGHPALHEKWLLILKDSFATLFCGLLGANLRDKE